MSQYRTLVNMGADRPGSLAAQQLAERVNTMQTVRRADPALVSRVPATCIRSIPGTMASNT